MRDEYDLSTATRGPVVQPDGRKTRITIRLDSDLIEFFRHQAERSAGGQYQALINRALRHYVEQAQQEPRREPLEGTLRRVLREELSRFDLPHEPAEG